MLFNKRKKITEQNDNNNSKEYEQALKEIRKNLISACFVVVSGVVAMVALTIAWFAVNKTVDMQNATISAANGETSLYIEAITETANNADAPIYSSATADSASLTGDLYPISTIDCANWYAAGTRNATTGLFETYVKANVEQSDTYPDRYVYDSRQNDGSTVTRTAYNLAEYWVYTDDNGTLDVYFDPTNSISVAIDSDLDTNERAQYLVQALRVGIMIDNTLVLVYAPVAESGTGNSQGAAANKLYAITGPTSAGLTEVGTGNKFYTSLDDFKAVNNGDGYQAGTTKLCNVGHAGKKVSIYLWLEGTDAQCIRGLSNGAEGVSVNISLAGITP